MARTAAPIPLAISRYRPLIARKNARTSRTSTGGRAGGRDLPPDRLAGLRGAGRAAVREPPPLGRAAGRARVVDVRVAMLRRYPAQRCLAGWRAGTVDKHQVAALGGSFSPTGGKNPPPAVPSVTRRPPPRERF